MSTTPLTAKEPIAIIGTGCRFPGSASSPSKLWKLLAEPYDLRRKLPDSRFNPEGVYHPDGKHHGTSNVKQSYILEEDHRHFDAQFFGIKPSEASSMDPQQRHLLEVIYEGLEAAGQRIENLKGSSTAVYVGLMYGEYGEMLVRHPEDLPTYTATGAARSIMANRVSYFFDWHGPSMTIDTACSSSLVALHHAVQALRLGECPIAIAAGSNLCLGPESYIAESKLQMLSPNGRSRMWDADADGYARGDGVAAVVLKLLKDAIADGDDIECIIRETAVNQDGRTRGITMPNSQAQTELIRTAYSRAGLDLTNPADRPQYFEAHGTGTPTGDPLEAAAIHQAFFGDDNASKHSKLYVGSIKSIIGHTEGTAGLAGIIKASLAIQNKRIPPNLWFHKLNPEIEPYYTHLHVPTESIEWPGDATTVRRASVNSFGFGGTNAHAIVEGLPPATYDQSNVTKEHGLPLVPLTFSAHSEVALVGTISQYAQHIKDGYALDARSLAHTLNNHRSQFEYRYAFGIDQSQTLLKNLESHIELLQKKEAQISNKVVKPGSARILGVFTGQGAQYGGMIRELYQKSPKIREEIEEFEKTLGQLPESLRPTWSLKEELLKTGKDSRVSEAALSQPLSTVVQIILVDLLRAAGIQFSAVVGHSSGEIVASYTAGFIQAADAVRIAYLRGLVTSTATGQPGGMIAVETSYEDATEICNLPNFEGRLCIAAVNSSSSLTLSGDLDAVEGAKDILEDEEKFARMLKVDKAYHSHHMLQFSEAYSDCLRQQAISIQKPPPGSPLWVSSVDVESFREAPPDLSSGYWIRNLTQPVLFHQAITKAILDLEVVDLAIEVGPHPALKAPASQSLQESLEEVVPYTGLLRRGQDSVKAFGDGIAQVWTTLGEASMMNLSNLEEYLSQSEPTGILKDLPTYPWVHERLFWHEARESKIRRSRNQQPNLLLGHRSTEDPGQQFRWRNILTPREIPWLSDHRIQGQRLFPAAGYVAVAMEAAAAMSQGNEMFLIELQDIVLGAALNFDDDDSRVEVLCTLSDLDHVKQQETSILTAKFHYFSAPCNDAGPMLLNAEGRLVIHYGSGSKDTLPPSADIGPGFTDVDHDRFYEYLVPLGYGYTGPFRGLSSLKRKLGAVSGIVSQPIDEEQPLIVHPAMLDCTIQTVLLAYSWPGDGRLWSLHIPTRIGNVLLNPKLAPANQPSAVHHYTFDTVLIDDENRGVTGNISVHAAGGQTLLRMEGLHAIPLEPAKPETDRKLFSKVVWDVAMPDAAKVVGDERASADDYRRAELLERVSHFYLRRLDNAFPPNDPIRSDGPWVGMLGFAHQTVEAVRQGSHICARADWADDDEKTIEGEFQKFPENIDLKIARIIGKNIISVVRGESNMLEHLRAGDTLDDYYANAMGIHYTEYVARLARQLSFKHPNLNFLEIGAGTGAATKSIFREIGKSYKSYTFTDISSAFFEAAQTTFSEHLTKMRFNTLDIEKDLEEQGYKPNSYDVVVASFVVHATRNLKDTLTRIRQLLRPGGYLLLLEVTNLDLARISFIFGSLPGWWLGEEPHRRYNPCVGTQEWGDLLLQSGFSGLDTVTSEKDSLPFPASAILSQAVDDQVSFLREPLCSTDEPTSSRISPNVLLIIGGRSKHASKLSTVIKSLTAQYFVRGTFEVDSLEQVQPTNFDPSGTIVLVLADLDRNVFEGLDEKRFQGLKILFNNAQRVFWVTNEARDNNPFHLMSVGFGRSMQMEMPHVQTQYVDLTDVNAGVALMLAEILLRFDALTSTETFQSEQILWPLEPEVCINSDGQLIHRIIHDAEKNHRYNSLRRDIALEVSVDANNPVEVSPRSGGYRLLPQRAQNSSSQSQTTLVETLFSTISAVQLDESSSLHVCLGTAAGDGRSVACLTESIATQLSVPDELMVGCREISPRFLGSLSTTLIAGAIVQTSSDCIVVVEPDEELAFAIRAHATSKPISLLFLTTDVNKVQPHHHYIHPSIGISELDLVIPRGCRRVLFTGKAEHAESRIKTWAQSRQVDVAGLMPVAQPYHSPRSSLSYLQNLLKSSIPIAEKLQGGDFEVLTLQDLTKFSLSRTRGMTIPIVDLRPTKAPVTIEPVDKYALLRSDRTYWLFGLSKSLGLSLCGWMIDHGAKHIVISSRSPAVEKSALTALRSKGANVRIIPCNIVDKQSVVAAHRLIQASMPPIAGVANGTMVLRDTMLEDMTIEEMNAVIHPKVIGSINLNDLFLNTQLDFFIFFSSAIGITGNVGQCNYAVANMFMHGLAAKRRKNGLAASVIVIGVILGVGYVTRETSQSLQDNLAKSGHNWLSERDLQILFAEAIRDGSASSPYQSEIVVGLKTIRQDDDHLPPWAPNPRFSHLILQSEDGGATNSTSNDNVPLRTKFLEATSVQEIYEVFRDELVNHVIKMLRMDDSVPKAQFLQYTAGHLGIDSLNAVDLRTWFMKEAKIDVPVLRILGGATLGDLLDFGLDLLSTDVAPAKAPDFQSSSKPSKTSAQPPTKAKLLRLTTVVPPTPAPVSKSTSTTANDIGSSNITQQEKPQPKPQGLLLKSTDSIKIAKTPPHPASSSTSDSSLGDSFSIINQLSPSSVSSKKSSQFVNVSKEKPDAQEILRSENLSRGQSRFWFLQSYVEDPTIFNITCLFKLQGKIDLAKFEQAVASIGRRHEALRTSISDHIHGKLEQHVLKEATLFLESQTWFEEDDVQLKFDELKEYSYDLAQGKLMRIVLLSPHQLSTLEHYLLIGYHHVNMDGISLEIILKELEDLYSGRSLDITPFQFADYAAYEDQKLFNGEWNQNIDYWKGRLNQAPEVFPVLPFGEAGMRQAIKTYGHVKSRLVIDSDTKKLIQRACKTYKVSPYHFYLATYLTLLARWAEVPEVCIGSSYANRHDSNRQTSVGLYLNPVALRLPYSGKNTFVSALETARKFSSEASMHSEVPFDVLLDNLKIERNPAFSPIFQTFINYRPRTDESRPFGSSSTLIGVEYESGKTPYDVMLDVFDGQQNESRIEVSLQKYLYSQDAVETLAKSYLTLVKSFARNPLQLLDNAALHGDQDLRDVAELGKGQNLKLTWGPTVIHRLEDLRRENSSRLAIRHRIEDTLTFDDMFDRIDRIYEALSDAAVTIGSAVGVHMQASADWICSALAIIKYGSIYVPLDFRQGKSRLKAIIKECQPAAILVDGQTLAPAEELTSDWKIKSINLTNIVGSAKMPTPIRSRASDQAAFYYTSGSTGIPKGIPLTNEGICNHMEGMSDRLKVTPHDVMLQQTAFSFDFSLWQILIALTNAASIVIVPDHLRRDAVGIVDLMVNNKVTMTATTPSEYSSWLRYGASKLRDSSWTRILCGGEPMPHGLLEDLWALGKADLRLEHLYGPTEITFIATTCPLDYSKAYTIIPIGRPIANYTIVILGKDGQALPAGVLGEIAIGSVGASTQYLNKPEESRQKFRSSMPALEKIGIPPMRFHLTGDEGWLSSEGLLYICGRIAGDTQMKLRGQRLDLLDIEQAIVHASSGSILEANVSASRDAHGADFLVAQVVLRQGSPEIDLPELAASLPLQQFMRPSVIFAVDKFPVTDHGKRDRRALASVNVSQLPRPKTKNVELTPEQQRIFSIWKDILPEETIGIHDITPDSDFFAVGGTSLTVLELQKRIQKDLGARLEVAALFESSSLRQMASLMEEQTELGISEENQIDWDKETQLDIQEDQFRNAKSMRDWIASSNNVDGIVVILTGATGFLGKALLRALIATTEVVKVHCLAVRQVEKLSEFADEPTVQIHTGDLTSPRLGLPEKVARDIFSESHVIIHNGADVSFLKTYASLRQSNVQSTRELIKLSLTYVDGGHDFHFVSTAGVLGFSGEREFPSNTASGFHPPTDGSFGYSASKWASERILERTSDAYGLSVSIYRPTNITGDQTPELDLVHNLVKFSQILKVVPDPKGIWDGFINFVSLDTCTDDILSSILHVAYGREPGIRYLHVTGPEDIPVDGLKSHLERNDGARTWYKQVSLAQWVVKAERAGLKPLTGAYLMKLASEKQQVYLTRVLKEKGTSDRAPDMDRTSSWNVFNGWRRT